MPWTEVLGLLRKTKYSSTTFKSMEKEIGESFPKELVYILFGYSLDNYLFTLSFHFSLHEFVVFLVNVGLKRLGKSCRLRWLNYLKPDIKRGNISSDEEDLIIRLHKLLGNRYIYLFILYMHLLFLFSFVGHCWAIKG